MQYTLYAGMSTGNAPQMGIHRFTVDTALQQIQFESITTQDEPQFTRLSPDRRMLYAVGFEGEGDGLYAYHIEADHSLTRMSHVSCYGEGPAYLWVDSQGKYLLSANYLSGNVVVTEILPDGSLGEMTDSVQHEGHGPNAERQEKPHAHIILLSEDDRFAYSCDLGIDKIMIYAFDAQAGKLTPAAQPYMVVPAGEGPRHISIHPNGRYAYLLTEMGCELFTYARDAQTGSLTQLGTPQSLVPDDYTGEKSGSEIRVHPNGRYLYQLNRGHDSIGVWNITNPADPTLVCFVPCGGATPRHFDFTPDGEHLIVANQDGCNLTGFDILPTGELTQWLQQVSMPNPMSITFLL